jgi:hypothetical protein
VTFEVFMAVRMMIMFWVLNHVDMSADVNISDKHALSKFSPEDGDSMFLQNGT